MIGLPIKILSQTLPLFYKSQVKVLEDHLAIQTNLQ